MSVLEEIAQVDIYSQYLRRLDAQAILDHYGAKRCSRQRNKDGTTEIKHSCLLDLVEPHHVNGDANPSACLNLDKRQYFCYSLGWGGDLLHFLMKMEGLEGKGELGDVMHRAADFLTDAVVSPKALTEELERYFETNNPYTINLPSYDIKTTLGGWQGQIHPYWGSRGVTKETICELGLGYDPRSHRIVFPHFVGGKLVGWQKRAIPLETPEQDPKYKSSPAFPKSHTLYNYDRAKSYPKVCVVESPMSVAHAHSLGIPNVVATFGAEVGREQLRLLSEFKDVYVWFDRDPAGAKGEVRVAHSLNRKANVMIIEPDKGKDLGDCGIEEIAIKIATATPALFRLAEVDRHREEQRSV